MTRNEARELMMQIMFELDASKIIEENDNQREEIKTKIGELAKERLSGGHIARCEKLIGSIVDDLDKIDDIINSNSTKWKTTRMPKVDLAIIRLAVGEIRYCDDIPKPVSINEAINMAKKYSTENSARFIHGVLGSIVKA